MSAGLSSSLVAPDHRSDLVSLQPQNPCHVHLVAVVASCLGQGVLRFELTGQPLPREAGARPVGDQTRESLGNRLAGPLVLIGPDWDVHWAYQQTSRTA